MGLKKYEIITVGSDKRVRALRSWRVQDRYVNIGDVGGIVYDEKTLSQDGACWLFRGNFNFPGARIGGDSIVDVGEAALSATGTPAVDILGSSVLVGSKLLFESEQTAANAVVLTAADFEQGGFGYTSPIGTNWENWKAISLNYVRTVKPIFAGGAPKTLKLGVPGYKLNWFALDRDSNVIAYGGDIISGEGITTVVPACHSFVFRLAKDPIAAIVPADATAAQIEFTGTYETKLSVIDSRVEVNPANATGTATIRPGGTYTFASGAKYPDSVIRNSKVAINGHATANRVVRLVAKLVNVNATIDATAVDTQSIGTYRNVKNLMFNGIFPGIAINVSAQNFIQAYNCDNFAVSSTIFPGLAAAQTANMPFIFQGCNVPDGIFYHHAQIANTYKNIDFALAQADLGKTITNPNTLVSSEVEGMYRLYSVGSSIFGALVESYDGVRSVALSNIANSYGTTIYKDAYLNGPFDFAGTNVFGNSMKHDASNTQVMDTMLYQGALTSTVGQVPTLVTGVSRVSTIVPFRINGANGILIDNIPAGIKVGFMVCDAQGKYVVTSTWKTAPAVVTNIAQLRNAMAYITFKKADDSSILLDDVKGVTITTYNGCKLVNTKKTAATIAGNVRVEDNATIIDTSVTGTGYFGGNAIIQAPSALVGQLPIEGAVYMSDNAVFAPSVVNASAGLSLLEMKDSAVFAGQLTGASTNYNITMADNAQFLGLQGSRSGFIMRGNSFVAAAGAVASACRGLLIMKDNARIENNNITAVGYITLCGKYKQTANKVWTGKRVIDSQDAPAYDNNVKTQYDF